MKSASIFIIVILNFCFLKAQVKDITFHMEISDSLCNQQLVLNKNYTPGELIDGYFYITPYERVIEGDLVNGGLSFTDSSVYYIYNNKTKKEIHRNKYPVGNIDSLTCGLQIEKALSFSIEPDFGSIKADSMLLHFKYYILKMKTKDISDFTDVDYNIKIHYQHIKVALNKPLAFDFIDKNFAGHKIVFKIKDNWMDNVLSNKKLAGVFKYVSPDELFPETDLKSLPDSSVLNMDFKFNSEFILEPSDNYLFNMTKQKPFFDKRIQCKELPEGNVLSFETSKSHTTFHMPPNMSMYQFCFTYPFHLYNQQKEDLYASYKTREQIFKSDYNLFIMPLSYRNDTLTAYIYLSYSKLDIDLLARWTPIRKKIKLVKNEPIKIELPKERWNANFEREGEKYDIYGYSDYEKFTNEFFIINFYSIAQGKDLRWGK